MTDETPPREPPKEVSPEPPSETPPEKLAGKSPKTQSEKAAERPQEALSGELQEPPREAPSDPPKETQPSASHQEPPQAASSTPAGGGLEALEKALLGPAPELPEEGLDAETREGIAAEYVLGTLTARERDAAEAMMDADAGFAELVGQWERRLGELHALSDAVDPLPRVWDGIKAKLSTAPPRGFVRLPALPRPRPLPTNVVDLTNRLVRWRNIAAGSGAMVAVLALFILTSALAPTLLPDSLRPRPRVIVQATEGSGPPPARYVAVLQRDALSPAFIVTVDVAERSLTMRRVAAERATGKSYELWLVSNKFPAPRSLGVVSGGEFTRSASLAAYDPATIEDASFAVSLEPEGGSPTGMPSNVMFSGKLVESTPP